MRLLSVDWDYFFPDTMPYDWGHSESVFLIEAIWQLRVTGRNIVTGEHALDAMRPDPEKLQGFWDRVLVGKPLTLFIAESHASIWELLKTGEQWDVVNFDQHHDIYYGSKKWEVSCDDWASHGIDQGLIERYTWACPQWAVDEQIIDYRPQEYSIRVQTSIEPQPYDAVFVCRSGAWTPPWADDEWLRFIGWWEENHPEIWEDRFCNAYSEQAREPSLDQAYKLRDQMREVERRARPPE